MYIEVFLNGRFKTIDSKYTIKTNSQFEDGEIISSESDLSKDDLEKIKYSISIL